MKKIALLSLLVALAALAEPPKFEMADVHVSPTRAGSLRISGACYGPGNT